MHVFGFPGWLTRAFPTTDPSNQLDKCQQAGMDSHLAKPLDLKALKMLLMEAARAIRLAS